MKVSTYTVEQTQYINVAVARNFQMYGWRNFPGSDPDTLFVWWHCNNAPRRGLRQPRQLRWLQRPDDQLRPRQGPRGDRSAKRGGYYEDINRQFSKQLYNLWTNWSLWTVATATEGPRHLRPDRCPTAAPRTRASPPGTRWLGSSSRSDEDAPPRRTGVGRGS